MSDYKVLWERDSASLGKCLQEIYTLRAVREDQRARIAALERELAEWRGRAEAAEWKAVHREEMFNQRQQLIRDLQTQLIAAEAKLKKINAAQAAKDVAGQEGKKQAEEALDHLAKEAFKRLGEKNAL